MLCPQITMTFFHLKALNYSPVDCEYLCDHLRDAPWENTFKLDVGIDIYILHCEYQVTFYLSPRFPVACNAPQLTEITSFVSNNIMNLLSGGQIQRCLQFLQNYFVAIKFANANKTKQSITSQKLGSSNFSQIANGFFNKG